MNKLNTKKDLKTHFFVLIAQCLIGSWFIFYNTYYTHLIFMVYLLVPTILALIFITILIGLDLTMKDWIVLKAKLIAKGHNQITVEDLQGNVKKFRLKNIYIKDIQEKDYIEIHYYKRTKAVINITISNTKT